MIYNGYKLNSARLRRNLCIFGESCEKYPGIVSERRLILLQAVGVTGLWS